MRGALLLVVAACSQRYGAYVSVEAGSAGAFDHLEMFFTTGAADTTGKVAPHNTSGAGPFVDPTKLSTEVFVRAFATTDSFVADAATSATFELPAGTNIGATVIAIATKNNVVVGYGRRDDLAVPDHDYVKYTLALAPQPAPQPPPAGNWPLGAQIWQPNPVVATGPGLACARVTDATTTTFVVTEGDADCDGYTEPDHDCFANFYCDPAVRTANAIDPCVSACAASVASSTNCAIGTCTNGSDPSAPLACKPPTPTAGNPALDCIPCATSCDYRPSDPFLDCVANHDTPPSVTCSFAVDQATNKLCNTASLATAQIALNTSGQCAATLLAPNDDFDFTFGVSVVSTGPCTLELDVTPRRTASPLAAAKMLLVDLPGSAANGYVPTASVRVQPMPVAATAGACPNNDNSCVVTPALTLCSN